MEPGEPEEPWATQRQRKAGSVVGLVGKGKKQDKSN